MKVQSLTLTLMLCALLITASGCAVLLAGAAGFVVVTYLRIPGNEILINQNAELEQANEISIAENIVKYITYLMIFLPCKFWENGGYFCENILI